MLRSILRKPILLLFLVALFTLGYWNRPLEKKKAPDGSISGTAVSEAPAELPPGVPVALTPLYTRLKDMSQSSDLLGKVMGPATDKIVGKIEKIDAQTPQPTVTLKGSGSSAFVMAGTALHAGDHVVTDKDQSAALSLTDGSQIVMGPSTDLCVDDVLATDGHTALSLALGTLHAIVNKIYSAEKPFTVATQDGLMGVRGTEFIVDRDATTGMQVHTLAGTVVLARTREALRSQTDSVTLVPGTTSAIAPILARPSAPQSFDPRVLFDRIAKTAPRFAHGIRENITRNGGLSPPPGATPPPAPAPVPVPAPAATPGAPPKSSQVPAPQSGQPAGGDLSQLINRLTPEQRVLFEKLKNNIHDEREALKQVAPEIH